MGNVNYNYTCFYATMLWKTYPPHPTAFSNCNWLDNSRIIIIMLVKVHHFIRMLKNLLIHVIDILVSWIDSLLESMDSGIMSSQVVSLPCKSVIHGGCKLLDTLIYQDGIVGAIVFTDPRLTRDQCQNHYDFIFIVKQWLDISRIFIKFKLYSCTNMPHCKLYFIAIVQGRNILFRYYCYI